MNKLPLFVLGVEIGVGLGLAVKPALERYRRRLRAKRWAEHYRRLATSIPPVSRDIEVAMLENLLKDTPEEGAA